MNTPELDSTGRKNSRYNSQLPSSAREKRSAVRPSSLLARLPEPRFTQRQWSSAGSSSTSTAPSQV